MRRSGQPTAWGCQRDIANGSAGTVPRVDLSHFRTGSGPPLLLLHPLGMANIVWRPVVPLLAREREVIALDLPGFGASPQGPHTVEGLAHCVAAFAAGLGLERPHVAGNSLGGAVALAMGEAGTVRVGLRAVAGRLRVRPRGHVRPRGPRRHARHLASLAAGGADARAQRGHAHSAVLARGRETVADPARGPRRVGPQLCEGGGLLGPARRARRLPRADADLPDHDRLGRPRPPADLLAPGAARSPHAPRAPGT